ncbi:uncharacterized protein K452DRAFT_298701 [Neofusicoccum parvum]|nr:uncharacterized protein K452DRAFT_298701 [Neofusicoccum parvum]
MAQRHSHVHAPSPNQNDLSLDGFKPDTKPCRATTNSRQLSFDAQRPFQCTHACGQKFPRKGEWIKHEQKSHPQRVWLCMMGAVLEGGAHPVCAYCRHPNPDCSHLLTEHWERVCEETPGRWCRKQFMRKDHLRVHLRTVHEMEELEYYEVAGRLEVLDRLERWYRWCGFCRAENCFARWKDRMDHIGRHFKKEGRGMEKWCMIDETGDVGG